MRKFVDLHLKPSWRDLEQVKSMVNKSAELGFRMVGLALPERIAVDEVNQLRNVCDDACVELATRVDLVPRSRHELLHGLRKLRRKFEIVSVFCASKVVARQAAKDRRVDLLSFPGVKYPRVFFDRAEAELASSAGAGLEIDLQPLLLMHGFARIRLLSRLRREVALTRRLKVPLVLSSGATETRFLHKPQDFAFLGILFNLEFPFALEALSETPLGIVVRNRQKLSPGYVAPGVRVVGRQD